MVFQIVANIIDFVRFIVNHKKYTFLLEAAIARNLFKIS